MSTMRHPATDPDFAAAPLVGLVEHWSGDSMPMHRHARHELVYAMTGVAHLVTAHGRWVLPPTQALWIPGGMEHGLFATRPVDMRILYLDPSFPGVPEFRDCTVLDVPPLVRELIAACSLQPWDYAERSAEARLARVLLDQLSSLAHVPVELPMPVDVRGRRMINLFQANPAGREPLTKLARLAGASLRTIERIFLHETGISVGTWRHRLRLLTALEQLAHGESVTNVALSVGYETASSFIVSFRAMFGMTPARYFAAERRRRD